MEMWIFQTSVQTQAQVTALQPALDALVQHGRWNFDLDDCDKILRIEMNDTDSHKQEIIALLQAKGYVCAELI